MSEMGVWGGRSAFELEFRRGAFNQRSIQTAKPEMEMELPRRIDCEAKGHAAREGEGGAAVYRKWRVQMNGLRSSATSMPEGD